MTYPPGPDHGRAHGDGSGRPDLPDDIDPTGIPTEATGRETFIMLVAILVALLALIVTVGWIVINHLGTT